MSVEIRPIDRTDVPAIVGMVHELAEYEKAADECHLTEAQLEAALFAEQPALFGHVALIDGEPAGMALWFLNFSTWRGVHGVYLEDLYVRPSARGAGVGRALLATLAAVCAERGYERLDWWVLHWNPAREFYHSIEAVAMDEWVPYRLTGPALQALAALAPATRAKNPESSLRGDAG
ncbi:GNAT family N-acetyltransferase [Planosporangium flavigriseum]|uniref:N-acetyltransferase n=1 Tax=Planosporangium flavigriseum TaxID=373681 RepID=A0A8J3LNX4_9ACTN|nr:GNAT family N-acetyltransferase [Planosporangium flavigriseum]NJC66697.1 GNAT family N-acetyltransferase [Planosporangium flavigriseum]GIG74849.1 N-acetyltransferase [Planosporangium flavigriseum]